MAKEKAQQGRRIGKSNIECTEIVRENRMEKPQTHLKGVQGPQFAKGGSSTPRDSFGYTGARMRSCGFGDSKTFAREGLPDSLNQLHFAIINLIDEAGPLSTEELAAALTDYTDEQIADALKDINSMRKTAKVDALIESKEGWKLMAEGRRIASELAEDD